MGVLMELCGAWNGAWEFAQNCSPLNRGWLFRAKRSWKARIHYEKRRFDSILEKGPYTAYQGRLILLQIKTHCKPFSEMQVKNKQLALIALEKGEGSNNID